MNEPDSNRSQFERSMVRSPQGPMSAEDQLPPVRPPSAAFLMQLFFIPLIIVAIIVTVWLLFSWVAHVGTRPDDLVNDLQRLDKGSWQQAVTLAQLLRDPRQDQLRQNHDLAKQIATILKRELEVVLTPQDRELNRVDFRIYLCRALGEFEVLDGLDALKVAAVTEHSPLDIPVRRAALQAISLLAGRLGGSELDDADPELVDALDACSQSFSDDPQQVQLRGQLRSTAAFSLGLVGGARAEETLVAMLSDPYADARYNAAIGLARHGNPQAVERLVEMLDPDNPALVEAERQAGSGEYGEQRMTDEQKKANEARRIEWKQALVLRNALRGTRQLLEQNPAAANQELTAAVQRLESAELDGQTEFELRQVTRLLAAGKR